MLNLRRINLLCLLLHLMVTLHAFPTKKESDAAQKADMDTENHKLLEISGIKSIGASLPDPKPDIPLLMPEAMKKQNLRIFGFLSQLFSTNQNGGKQHEHEHEHYDDYDEHGCYDEHEYAYPDYWMYEHMNPFEGPYPHHHHLNSGYQGHHGGNKNTHRGDRQKQLLAKFITDQ